MHTSSKTTHSSPTACVILLYCLFRPAAPLYCWILDSWAVSNPEKMAQLRSLVADVVSKPLRKQASVSALPTILPLPEEEAVRPFLVLVRACHMLLYRLSVSCWVANHSEWRKLLVASSYVIDPTALFRLHDFPFVSLVASCQSTLFWKQPASNWNYASGQQSDEYSHPGLRLVDRCGIMQLVGTSPVTFDVQRIYQLVAISHSWFPVFRRPELDFVPVELTKPLMEQQLQQIETYVKTIVARLPLHCNLDGAVTAVAAQLGLVDSWTGTEPVSSAQPLLMRLQTAVQHMADTAGAYMRKCVWQRCRAELIAMCTEGASQLHSAQLGLAHPCQRLESLKHFLNKARLTLQHEFCGADMDRESVTQLLLHDEMGCLKGLSLLLAELNAVHELNVAETPPRSRPRHTLLKLASLYLAIVHPHTNIARPSRQHQHSTSVDGADGAAIGASDQCLQCVEQRLNECVQRMMPPRILDEPAGWMKDVAQQTGVSVEMLVRFNELLDSHAAAASSTGIVTPLNAESRATQVMGCSTLSASSRPKISETSDVPMCCDEKHSIAAVSTKAAVTSDSSMCQLPCVDCKMAVCDALLSPCCHVTCCQRCAVLRMEDDRLCPRCSTHIKRIFSVCVDPTREILPLKRKLDKTSSGGTIKKRAAHPRDSNGSVQQHQRDEQTHSPLHSSQMQLPMSATAGADTQQITALPDTASGSPVAAMEVSHPHTVKEQIADTVKSTSAASIVDHSLTNTETSDFFNPLETLASLSNQLLSSPSSPVPNASVASPAPSDSGASNPSLSVEQAGVSSSFSEPHLIRCRVKTGVVRFTCSVCARVFENNSSNAHLHMTTHHSVTRVPVMGEDGQVKYRKQRTHRHAADGAAAGIESPSHELTDCNDGTAPAAPLEQPNTDTLPHSRAGDEQIME